MRMLFALMLLVGLVQAGAMLPGPTRAEPAIAAEDRAAMTAVISDQMAAFQRDDGDAAFAFAAPEIQMQFGTPEAFMTMVRRGYAPVYRPQSVEFQAPEHRADRPVVPVIVGAPDGHLVRALYTMRQLDDGSWRIAGCTLERLPDMGV